MKNSISIIGSCVTNMIIRYNAIENHKNLFLVKSCITRTNPLTFGTDKVPNSEILLTKAHKGINMTMISRDFCINKDLNKLKKADYLILDVADLNYSIIEIMSNNAKYYISKDPLISAIPKKEFDEWLKENGYTAYEVSNPLFEYEYEDITKLLDGFIQKIKEEYKRENIIFIRTMRAVKRIRWDGSIDLDGFDKENIKKTNIKNRQIEDYIIKELEIENVVDSFDNVIATDDIRISSSANPTHYDGLFYEYGLEALDVCTENISKEDKTKRLREIWEKYNKTFEARCEERIKYTLDIFKEFRNYSTYEYRNFREIRESKIPLLSWTRKQNNINDFGEAKTFFESTNLNDYISEVKEGEYIIFLAVRERADRYWRKWVNRNSIGITTDLSNKGRKSFCAIINLKENIVIEKFADTNDELELTYEMIVKDPLRFYNGKNCELPIVAKCGSKGRDGENLDRWARILVNNVDYSINKLGLNVVVFSIKYASVVDSFYVNFWADPNLTIRRM